MSHTPVTAEELATADRCTKSLAMVARYHAEHARFGGVAGELHATATTTAQTASELLPRLTSDLATARSDLAKHYQQGVELASLLAAERETTKRLADRVLDLGRELEALRAAVREHEAARSIAVTQADRDLWSAAKVSP